MKQIYIIGLFVVFWICDVSANDLLPTEQSVSRHHKNGKCAIFAQHPILGSKKIGKQGSVADNLNLQRAHEHIFFIYNGKIINNIGFGADSKRFSYSRDEIESGEDAEGRIDDYVPLDDKCYDPDVINEILGISETKCAVPEDGTYLGIINNCQGFTDRVRKEYKRRIELSTYKTISTCPDINTEFCEWDNSRLKQSCYVKKPVGYHECNGLLRVCEYDKDTHLLKEEFSKEITLMGDSNNKTEIKWDNDGNVTYYRYFDYRNGLVKNYYWSWTPPDNFSIPSHYRVREINVESINKCGYKSMSFHNQLHYEQCTNHTGNKNITGEPRLIRIGDSEEKAKKMKWTDGVSCPIERPLINSCCPSNYK